MEKLKKSKLLTKPLLYMGLFLTMTACKKEVHADKNLHIIGNIEGLSQGKIYIGKVEDTLLTVLDSIHIKGTSQFNSHLQLESPEVLYLFLDRGKTNSIDNSLPFFAEAGTITIDTKLKTFFASAKISGSKNQELWETFNATYQNFKNQKLQLTERRLKNQLNFNQSTQDSIEKAEANLAQRQYLYVLNFAVSHADYEIAPYLALTEIPNINPVYLDSIIQKMPTKVAQSKYGELLKKHITAQ